MTDSGLIFTVPGSALPAVKARRGRGRDTGFGASGRTLCLSFPLAAVTNYHKFGASQICCKSVVRSPKWVSLG